MSVFQIKLVATMMMIIDHMGLFLFPQLFWMRLVGRISFPLFAWLIANGVQHTRSSSKYILRLFMLGLLSQIPYWLLFKTAGYGSVGLNVLFTLCLGALSVVLIKSAVAGYWKVVCCCVFAFVAQGLQMDFGMFGVLVVIGYSLFNGWIPKMTLVHVLLAGWFFVLPGMYRLWKGEAWNYEVMMMTGQAAGLISLLFIWKYNGNLGIKEQRWFYWVYPGHLFMLYFLLFLIQH